MKFKAALAAVMLVPVITFSSIATKVDLAQYKDTVDTWAVHAKPGVYSVQHLINLCKARRSTPLSLNSLLDMRQALKKQLAIYYKLDSLVHKAVVLSLSETLRDNEYVEVTSTKILRAHLRFSKVIQNKNPCNIEYM